MEITKIRFFFSGLFLFLSLFCFNGCPPDPKSEGVVGEIFDSDGGNASDSTNNDLLNDKGSNFSDVINDSLPGSERCDSDVVNDDSPLPCETSQECGIRGYCSPVLGMCEKILSHNDQAKKFKALVGDYYGRWSIVFLDKNKKIGYWLKLYLGKDHRVEISEASSSFCLDDLAGEMLVFNGFDVSIKGKQGKASFSGNLTRNGITIEGKYTLKNCKDFGEDGKYDFMLLREDHWNGVINDRISGVPLNCKNSQECKSTDLYCSPAFRKCEKILSPKDQVDRFKGLVSMMTDREGWLILFPNKDAKFPYPTYLSLGQSGISITRVSYSLCLDDIVGEMIVFSGLDVLIKGGKGIVSMKGKLTRNGITIEGKCIIKDCENGTSENGEYDFIILKPEWWGMILP